MAKAILPYSTNNNLAEHVRKKSEDTGKGIDKVEAELAKYCSLQPGTMKKYKLGQFDPSLPVALKVAEFFGVMVDDIWNLKEE